MNASRCNIITQLFGHRQQTNDSRRNWEIIHREQLNAKWHHPIDLNIKQKTQFENWKKLEKIGKNWKKLASNNFWRVTLIEIAARRCSFVLSFHFPIGGCHDKWQMKAVAPKQLPTFRMVTRRFCFLFFVFFVKKKLSAAPPLINSTRRNNWQSKVPLHRC